jgi:serine/threonine protein kinase
MSALKLMVIKFFNEYKSNSTSFDEKDFINYLQKSENKASEISMYQMDNNIQNNQKLLKMIKIQKSFDHDNIAKINDCLVTNNFMFVESETMDFTLKEVLSAKKGSLSENHIKYMFYQMVLAVANLHKNNVEHFDLHPKSFQVAKDCEVKLTNFYQANPTFLPKRNELKSTSQNYYTAPEIILNNGNNSHCKFKSDIWALGCLFFEMLEEKNVFYHQRYYLDQIKWIFKLLGTPLRTNMDWIRNFEAKKWVSNLGKIDSKLASSYIGRKDFSKEALDLLDKILTVNPNERLSALEILKHPFFKEIYDTSDINFSKIDLSPKSMFDCHPMNENLMMVKTSLVREAGN